VWFAALLCGGAWLIATQAVAKTTGRETWLA